jgi:hypothetical protein
VPVRLFHTNWMQIEEYLRRDDRVVRALLENGWLR